MPISKIHFLITPMICTHPPVNTEKAKGAPLTCVPDARLLSPPRRWPPHQSGGDTSGPPTNTLTFIFVSSLSQGGFLSVSLQRTLTIRSTFVCCFLPSPARASFSNLVWVRRKF